MSWRTEEASTKAARCFRRQEAEYQPVPFGWIGCSVYWHPTRARLDYRTLAARTIDMKPEMVEGRFPNQPPRAAPG